MELTAIFIKFPTFNLNFYFLPRYFRSQFQENNFCNQPGFYKNRTVNISTETTDITLTVMNNFHWPQIEHAHCKLYLIEIRLSRHFNKAEF